MGELVTLGEAMAVTRVSGIGPPSPGAAATLSYAGAEATVAIGWPGWDIAPPGWGDSARTRRGT
ncbi:hypothetical protein ABZ907_37880 [Nonomuraea wenchangensis]